MPNYVKGINPAILVWAREKSGYSIEDVARLVKKDISVIINWETGQSLPTYGQLEVLANQLYKRPIAFFFFPEPPVEADPGQSFRTLPELEVEKLLPDTRLAIRQAISMQISLNEINNGINPIEKKIFQDIHIRSSDEVVLLANKVRDYLGVHLDQQVKWKNNDEALDNWRNIIQDAGIFIFKRSFKQNDISGFCLTENNFPIIYVNNGSSDTRQIFTIIHELAHLLLDTSGITKTNDRYLDLIEGINRETEIFCNHFAAEFLVPSIDFNKRIKGKEYEDNLVNQLSKSYHVSREVILRKYLNLGVIDKVYYESRTEEWNNEFQDLKKSKKAKGGGNYYATQAIYLGDKYLKLAFTKFYQGQYSKEQLAEYLNVNVKSVDGMEHRMYAKV